MMLAGWLLFLWDEFVMQPWKGMVYLITCLYRREYPVIPEGLRGRWDMKAIVKDNWMLFLCCIAFAVIGWHLAAVYYNLKVNDAAIILTEHYISKLPYCQAAPGQLIIP